MSRPHEEGVKGFVRIARPFLLDHQMFNPTHNFILFLEWFWHGEDWSRLLQQLLLLNDRRQRHHPQALPLAHKDVAPLYPVFFQNSTSAIIRSNWTTHWRLFIRNLSNALLFMEFNVLGKSSTFEVKYFCQTEVIESWSSCFGKKIYICAHFCV